MAETMMAFPELRHPFEASPIHSAGSATVLYQGNTTTLEVTGSGEGLLISAEDLTRINGFVLKPEGACFGDLCIPLNDNLLVEQDNQSWFDLTAFADLLEQPYVVDTEARVWSFAEMPAKRDSMMVNAKAPNFEVVDRQGKVIRMADFKGKKALIVTWSSW
jgi:hypothetical protein